MPLKLVMSDSRGRAESDLPIDFMFAVAVCVLLNEAVLYVSMI